MPTAKQSGRQLRLLSVHLISGCWGMREDRNQKRRPICDTLRGQILPLKDWADARQAVGAPCPVSFRIVPGMLAWNVSEYVGRNPSPA